MSTKSFLPQHSQSFRAVGATPADVASHILAARAEGRTMVAAFHAPSGFVHFDGRDAEEVVAPALGMEPVQRTAPMPGLESRMNEPYGLLGVADDSPLLERLGQAGVTLVAAQSILQLKETQLLVDAGMVHAAPRKPLPLPTPQGGVALGVR